MTNEKNRLGAYYDLDENSPQILQPKLVKVELKQHQKTAINAMIELETTGYVDAYFRYYSNSERLLRIETHIGILNDIVGSGKTLIITSLLLENPRTIIRPNYYASDNYTTIREVDFDGNNISDHKHIPINVIVVPKGIHHQWIECFNEQIIDFNYVSLLDSSERSNLDNLSIDILTNNNEIVTILCNDTTVQYLFDKYTGCIFNRIIIDEADTLKFSTLRNARSEFIWLVTGTTDGIPYSNKKYIKEIFNKNLSWQPDFLTVKNNNDFIKQSLNLPKPNRYVIPCKTPYEVMILGEHIPKDVMNMINAGNTDKAINRLNCQIDTPDNIYKVIATKFEMAVQNKTVELDAEKKKKYKSKHKKKENEIVIKKIENVITKLKNKQKALKKSIFDHNGKICPICMTDMKELIDSDVKVTMVDCCACKYCLTCIMAIFASSSNKCPSCQKMISTGNMHIIENTGSDSDTDSSDDSSDDSGSDSSDDSCSDSSDDSCSDSSDDSCSDSNSGAKAKSNKSKKVIKSKKYNKIPKMDALISILNKNNKQKRYLIFADYNETFEKIKKELTELKIKYGILTGGGNKIQKTVEKFKNGKISVIMLNAQNFGAGLNLQCATDIIMYHRFTKRMEEQIIGRGQRMGREGALNVYYLIHNNEKDVRDEINNDTNKDFEDFDYEEYLETL
jgi:hypothetical protein